MDDFIRYDKARVQSEYLTKLLRKIVDMKIPDGRKFGLYQMALQKYI